MNPAGDTMHSRQLIWGRPESVLGTVSDSPSEQWRGRPPTMIDPAWWRRAVVYQVYIRSFADGDGDGVGDIAGLRSRLPYLQGLGVDALWITPWYPSPMADGGYDIADHRGIDPQFGTLEDAGTLIREAHALGLRVMLDIVPNHTSAAHPWFTEALRGPARIRRPLPLRRPRRAGQARGAAAERMGERLRRCGMVAAARRWGLARAVVPPPLRCLAA